MLLETVMARTLSGEVKVQPDHVVRITLPEDVSVETVKYTITVPDEETADAGTFGDFAHSEFFGMWKDRTDIKDSVEFARELRDRAWRRSA